MYKVVHLFKNTYNSDIKVARLLTDSEDTIDVDVNTLNDMINKGQIYGVTQNKNGENELNISNIKITTHIGSRESLEDWCKSHGDRGEKLLREWNEEYLLPSEVSAHSTVVFSWKCFNLDEYHTFNMSIHYRTSSNRDCNRCGKYGNTVFDEQSLKNWCIKNNREDILDDYNRADNDIEADSIKYNYSKKVKWKCINGHLYESAVNLRTNRDAGCWLCKQVGTSKIECLIYLWIKSILNNEVEHRYKLDNTEFDIYIKELRLAIDYRGHYYHSNRLDTDIEREKKAKLNNIDLLIIQETDNKNNIIDDNIFYIYKSDRNKLESCISFISNILLNKYSIDVKNINIGVLYKEYNNFIGKIDIEKSLGYKMPHLVDYWGEKDITIFDVLANDTREYKFKCIKCSTEYKTVPHTLSQKKSINSTGCPVCSGRKVITGKNDLATTQPNILKIWDFDKNIESPYEITRSKKTKVYTICPRCGYNGYYELSSILTDTHCKLCGYSTLVEDKSIEYTIYNCDGCRDNIEYIIYIDKVYYSLDILIRDILESAIENNNVNKLLENKILYSEDDNKPKKVVQIDNYCYTKVLGNPGKVRQLINIVEALNISEDNIRIKFMED